MNSKTNSLSSGLINQTGTSLNGNWSFPKMIKVYENGDSIEMIYKETSLFTYCTYPSNYVETRIFKIIYSCIDGKWNKSGRIYGQIIPPSEEQYKF